jgi:hypothetical protein
VPFNVNQHYRSEEIHDLLEMLGTEAVVYHRALGPLVREALQASRSERQASEGQWQGRELVLVDVDDGSGVPALAGSTDFADAAARAPTASCRRRRPTISS